MKKILVAGGARSLVYGNLSRKLEKNDLTVGWYISDLDGDPFRGIPSDCDAVLVIRDIISHSLYHEVNKAAKEKPVPIAVIPRKWSKAEPLLRMHGILPPARQPSKGVPKGRVTETAKDYVHMEMLGGRVPKAAEVEAAVQTALGPKVTVSAKSVHGIISWVRQGLPVQPEKIAEDLKQGLKDATVMVDLFAEDNPAAALRVPDLMKGASLPTKEMAGDEIDRLRARWLKDKAWRHKCQGNWLRRVLIKVQAEDLPWPNLKQLYAQSRALFGLMLPHTLAVDVRADVLGEWARHLDANKASAYLKQHAPELDLITLCKTGHVKHLHIGTRYVTSVMAITEYLDETNPEQVEAQGTEEAPTSAPAPTPAPNDDLMTLASLVEEKLAGLIRPLIDEVIALRHRVEEVESVSPEAPVTLPPESPVAGVLDLFKHIHGLEIRFITDPKKGG